MNNIQELKKIPIINILNKLNIEAVEKKKDEFWLKGPWRNEQSASVKCQNNLFYDFGEGTGGNTIDFVMKVFSIDFKQSIKWLQNEFDSFSFHQPAENSVSQQINKGKTYSITKVQPLQNNILINYLKSRCLNISICDKYLCEVYYQLNNKIYFGVGFKNDLQGFEIRNKYVKMCLGIKWFTHIKNQTNHVIVFESWSDFISLLTLYPELEKSHNYIILNSLATLKKLDAIFQNYSEIMFALDNDEAGSKATKFYVDRWQNSLIDIRFIYPNSKDINDFLCKPNK